MEIIENRKSLMIQIKMFHKFTQENKDKLEHQFVNKEMIYLLNSFNHNDLRQFTHLFYDTGIEHYDQCIEFFCHCFNLYKICDKTRKKFDQILDYFDLNELTNNQAKKLGHLYHASMKRDNIEANLNMFIENYEKRITEIRKRRLIKNGNGRFMLIRKDEFNYVVRTSHNEKL